jgi:hypothetical protein
MVVELDKYDYIGFDFNNEPHKVSGHLEKGQYRILLKLHYIVYKNSSKKHIDEVQNNFVEFEKFTISIMKL